MKGQILFSGKNKKKVKITEIFAQHAKSNHYVNAPMRNVSFFAIARISQLFDKNIDIDLISAQKYNTNVMLWVPRESVTQRSFQWVSTAYVCVRKSEKKISWDLFYQELWKSWHFHYII